MNNDPISRKYIQEQIPELDSYDNGCYVWLKREDVDNLIDNAPTIKTYCYFCGQTEHGQIEEKPQGKWIAREDMDYLDENKVVHYHFVCNKCGLIHDFIDGHPSQYKFCPNCGADMRGDTNG